MLRGRILSMCGLTPADKEDKTDSGLNMFIFFSHPLLLQWTVSGPAGPSGVRAQQAVVREDRTPPESSCVPASMEGLRVRALTTAP